MAENIINLPFGSEFSPSQIQLSELLDFCNEADGNKEKLESMILAKYFAGQIQAETKAMNSRLGLQSYLLLDDSCHLTAIGRKLLSLKDNEQELYKEFAKHILLNVNGLAFINALDSVNKSGETITLAKMPVQLKPYGIVYPKGGKHPSILRLWLDFTGLTNKKWQVDREILNEILGENDPTSALTGLDTLQKGFLKALINSGKCREYQSASNIVKLASTVYGITFPDKNLPALVLNALSDRGLIKTTKTTTGRGAKPFLVMLHPDVSPEVILPTLEQLKKQIDPKLYELLQKPLADILEELNSKNTYIAGLALEALAFKLMGILDMKFMFTRLRGEQTGGAEVDLVFESDRLVYSRWQIQCKNTKTVSLDPVAKEVGLTHFLKSNVVVVVTTGRFSSEARKYSDAVMKDSNLAIVLIDGDDIRKVSESPEKIIDIFNKSASRTMEIKKIEH